MLAYFAAGLLLRRAYRPPCLPNYALLNSIPDCAIITEKCGCRLGTTISGAMQSAIRSLVGVTETPQAFVAITQSGNSIAQITFLVKASCAF